MTLSGQIAGAEDAIAARLVKSGIADTHQAPERVGTPAPLETPISASGFFTIGPVLPGSYTLEVLVGDELIEITNLQL
jgi:hypothetical protein